MAMSHSSSSHLDISRRHRQFVEITLKSLLFLIPRMQLFVYVALIEAVGRYEFVVSTIALAASSNIAFPNSPQFT